MLKIIAIGGGEIRRPKKEGGFYKNETLKIDKEIVSFSGKKSPKLLFIPTASSDAEGYFEVIKKHFTKLSCRVDALYLIKDNLSEAEIKNKILNSDIIYVGGGNTLKMMNIWRKNNLDKILKLAVKRGIVLSGISAGSICWFKSGLSDSRKFTGKNDKFDFIKVSGLDFVDALHCPHYDAEPERRVALKKIMKKTSGVAIAIDNGCALQILDDKYRLIKSKKTARAFRVFWFKGRFICETINLEKNFKLLKNLVTKFS